jgi:DNA-binding CsgD family transcriptional regulator
MPLERIPPAKREVLELLRSGRRNSEIARALGRSPHTVRNQLASLFQTFNVKSRAELVAVLSRPVVQLPPSGLRRRRR